MERCKAITKKGKQCKNSINCAVHPQPITFVIPNVELLKRSVVNKIKRKLTSGPKESDGSGTIYVYMLDGECGMNYFKVGMTQRNDVNKRLKEWTSNHQQDIILVATFKVTLGIKWVERVVHLMLDYCRLHRYPSNSIKNCYKSVYSASGRVVKDEHWKSIQKEDPTERFVAKNKHVEWVFLPKTEVIDVITQVCIDAGGAVTISK